MTGNVRHLKPVDRSPRSTSASDESPEHTLMPQPNRIDSTADMEGALQAADQEFATEVRGRQEAIATKRRRAQLNQGLLQRSVQGASKPPPRPKPSRG